LQGVKIIVKEADGDLTIVIRKAGIYRPTCFFKELSGEKKSIAGGKYEAAFRGRRVQA
jgi:hypothetical protein